MAEEEIPYGLRRAPLAMVMFSCIAVGFLVWSDRVDGETFLFPLGRVSEETASLYLSIVAIAALAYAALLAYVRYWRRPVVRIGDGEITLVIGELAGRTLTLRRGQVRAFHESRTRGGWRACRVEHEDGEVLVQSAQFRHDAAYEKVCKALRKLAGSSEKPARRES